MISRELKDSLEKFERYRRSCGICNQEGNKQLFSEYKQSLEQLKPHDVANLTHYFDKKLEQLKPKMFMGRLFLSNERARTPYYKAKRAMMDVLLKPVNSHNMV